MIFVDTNIFVLALRYPRDRNAAANKRFLEYLSTEGSGVTSLVCVWETSGILSFNLNLRQLRSLRRHFARRFRVEIVDGAEAQRPFYLSEDVVASYIERKMSFGDALVAMAVDRMVPEVEAFVSWNARHFVDRVGVSAMTPSQVLGSL